MKTTRLGSERQTAGQGGALVADGMAVTLLVGGDAGVGGDVANGIGQDDLQSKGSWSGMYERSGGAERSRRGIRQEEPGRSAQGSMRAPATGTLPEVGLAHADNGGDAMPGGVALTFESAEVGGGDGERAVIEELAHRLDRLADVATELGGGVAEDVNARRSGRPAKRR